MSRVLPNAILIGAQKSGTTALYDWIGQHPDVYGNPTMKDFPFFCDDGYYKRGLNWFSKCFSGWKGQRVVLHGYVHYLSLYRETAVKLRQFDSSLKIIVVLRNPADRAYSAYLQARKTGNEPLDTFEQAIEFEQSETLRSFSDITNRGYITHGYYNRQLGHFLSLFAPEQIFVALFDDLLSDPNLVCKNIYTFLGIDNTFRPSIVRRNDYGEVRFKKVQKFIAKGIPSDVFREQIPIGWRIRMRRFINKLNTSPAEKPAMADSTRKLVESYYGDVITELEGMLERDLSSWRSTDE